MRCGMEGKERQSLSKDTRSKRSICTYARMRLAVADLTVLTVPRLPVQRGPAATRCDGSGSLLPDLLRLNLLAWSGAHPLLQRCSSGRRHHELETRPRASFFCRALHQSTLKAFTCTLVRVRIGSNSFAACRARLLLSPNVICFGSSAEHAPSRVTSHTTNPLRSARHVFLRLRRQPAPGPRSSDQRPRLWPARRLCQLQWRGSR